MMGAVRQPLVPGAAGRALLTALVATLLTSGLYAQERTQAKQPGAVTFTRDVAPILQRSCQSCHHPGSIAPMSLLTYDEVRPWARSIKLRTGLRDKPQAMPPWFIEKNVGIQQFKNDISLNDEEVAKIARWADGGAPQSNPADMPLPRTFPDAARWQLGVPDL